MLRACCGWQRPCDTAAREDLEGKADALGSPLLSMAHWHLATSVLKVACTPLADHCEPLYSHVKSSRNAFVLLACLRYCQDCLKEGDRRS